jgi:hypothetical protein
MEPFEKAYLIQNPEKDKQLRAVIRQKFSELPEELIDKMMEDGKLGDVYKNDTYTVIVRDADKSQVQPGCPDMIWISIKRNDRLPIHDWRDLQEIKNIFVGKENEAVELYPADKRVVDTANQYHLWAFKDKAIRFPFGFPMGLVDYETSEKVGAVQRQKTV